MTLKELRSLCLVGIQDLQPDDVMPDVDADIRRSIRKFTEDIGGIFRTATLTTAAGKREYAVEETADYGAGFPADFMKSNRIIRSVDGIRVRPILKWDRDDTATGTPTRYYLSSGGRVMGFDRIPTEAIEMEWDYMGTGDDATGDDDVILSGLPISDDDPLWDGIVFDIAETYFRKKMMQAKGDDYLISKSKWRDMKTEGIMARLRARGFFNSYNADLLSNIKEPDWMRTEQSSIISRLGNDGDIVRILK